MLSFRRTYGLNQGLWHRELFYPKNTFCVAINKRTNARCLGFSSEKLFLSASRELKIYLGVTLCVQSTPETQNIPHQVLSMKEVYYKLWGPAPDWTKTDSRPFSQEWAFKERKGEGCVRMSQEVLIGPGSQHSQCMNFDCWTLVF